MTMAFPTAVNNQITDSITQSNVKVIADAPAVAMGNLYQATSQALSNAAHNATTNQQQMGITMQAALVQGITTLYGIDVASGATPASHLYRTQVSGPSEQISQPPASVTDSAAQVAELSETLAAEQQDASRKIEDAVRFALDCNLDSADRFNHAVREVMDAFVTSLQAIGDSQYRSALDMIRMAGITMTLKAMIEQPGEHEHYAQILESIKNL
tara:strand:- start:292 stop:930 length:639 start_codon:yes stop_codon:yes gene_type:complete